MLRVVCSRPAPFHCPPQLSPGFEFRSTHLLVGGYRLHRDHRPITISGLNIQSRISGNLKFPLEISVTGLPLITNQSIPVGVVLGEPRGRDPAPLIHIIIFIKLHCPEHETGGMMEPVTLTVADSAPLSTLGKLHTIPSSLRLSVFTDPCEIDGFWGSKINPTTYR